MKDKPEKKTAVKTRAKLEQLQQQIDRLQKEKDELFAKLQRIGADYDNFQKRSSRQLADSLAYEKETLIKTILPALDNFEHTLANAEKSESVDVLAKGVKIIYDQLLSILKSHGVEQIEAAGEPFDPARHEAMLQKTQQDKEDGVVLEEYQKGYKLNSRVIRPAKVIVNKIPAEQGGDEPEQENDSQ